MSNVRFTLIAVAKVLAFGRHLLAKLRFVEKGFITIDSDYKVRVSDKAKNDPALYDEISKYDGVKINLPKIKENRPSKSFLIEHKNRVS